MRLLWEVNETSVESTWHGAWHMISALQMLGTTIELVLSKADWQNGD